MNTKDFINVIENIVFNDETCMELVKELSDSPYLASTILNTLLSKTHSNWNNEHGTYNKELNVLFGYAIKDYQKSHNDDGDMDDLNEVLKALNDA